MWELFAAALVTFFIVIDPIAVAPLFISVAANHTAAERRVMALRGVAVAGLVLLLFAIAGSALLSALSIGLPAFRIAGGILLLLLAIDMVMARHTGLRSMTPNEGEESGHRADVSVFPLAIPLLAGPGALTSVVLLMARAEGSLLAQFLVVAVLAAVLALALACLLLAERLVRLLGVTGVNVISRVAGIILSALAVQFVLDGVAAVAGSF